MKKRIVVIGALDTKSQEYGFVKEEIERRGHEAKVIDTGVIGEPGFEPDISSSRVAEAAGENLQAIREKADRGFGVDVMCKGVAHVVQELYQQGKLDGLISMGGSAGTNIGSSAMRALPIGVPKVMVTTLASGDVQPYVGTKDVVIFPSIVDVAGVNRISARIYANAVGAVVGMAETSEPKIDEKPLLAASMFGNTTPIVNRCRETMEDHGYEVLVFHGTGTGGQTLESLVEEGYISAVMEITPTELADELVGGVLSAGPTRMDAASKKGVPQVIVPGCVDMANFWARETVPEKYNDRLFFQWAPNVTLMRTTPEENAELGRILAEKANRSSGPVAFLFPMQGVSMLDAPGKEFWWPEANRALYDAIRETAKAGIEIHEMENNVNDDEFADAVSEKMLEFLGRK